MADASRRNAVIGDIAGRPLVVVEAGAVAAFKMRAATPSSGQEWRRKSSGSTRDDGEAGCARSWPSRRRLRGIVRLRIDQAAVRR
jgi:hypothetical protein